MNLYEHQSTYCANMPLRGIGYFADLYKMHLGGEEFSKERMHSRKLIQIPAPKYYVFYNGTESAAEREDLHLSNAYDGEGDVEVTAHMINVNKGHNKDLMDQCKPMADYAEFVSKVRDCIGQGYSKEEAVGKAIDECISEDILAELLRRERARVENILIQGLTDEEWEHLRQMEKEEDVAEAVKQGLEQGIEQAKMNDVDKLVAENILTEERACEVLGVDIEKYKEYKAGKA